MEKLTPSQILEQYDIIERDVPKKLIEEIRSHFRALEERGTPPWKILCDEVAGVNNDSDEIDENRLHVAQAVAEVLTNPVDPDKPKKGCIDGLSWNKRIADLKTMEDYLHFFALLNIPREVWSNSSELQKNNLQGIIHAIRYKFGSFTAFKEAMGLQVMHWSEEGRRCGRDPEKWKALFEKNDIPQEIWNSLTKLYKTGWSGVFMAIRDQFGSFTAFKEAMGLRMVNWSEEGRRCGMDPEKWRALFEEHDIPEEIWKSSNRLGKNDWGCLCHPIRNQFKNFTAFKVAMGLQVMHWSEEGRRCGRDPEKWKALFEEHNIPPEIWNSSKKLSKTGWLGVYMTIRDQFGSFTAFKVAMGLRMVNWSEEGRRCGMDPEKWRALFEEHNIPPEIWNNSSELQKNNLQGILHTINHKFGSFTAFKEAMGIEVMNWSKEGRRCGRDPEKWRALFEEHNIPPEIWTIPSKLEKIGYTGLYKAIGKQFNDLDAFKEAMGIEVMNWSKEGRRCGRDPEKWRALFESHNIPPEIWSNSQTLQNDSSGLYKAIKEQFEVWISFMEIMDLQQIKFDEEFETISQLSLEEAISFLGSDPYKLKLYLQNVHQEITEEDMDRIIIRSFKGLAMGSNMAKEKEYLKYPKKLASITVQKFPRATEEATITIEGSAPEGGHIHIAGCWNRRVRVKNGRFSVVIPLKQGEENEFRLMAVDTANKVRSTQRTFVILQDGEQVDDLEALILMLDTLSAQLLSDIRNEPGRFEYFKKCAEQVLIKKFSRSFEEGEEYIQTRIEQAKSATIRMVLRGVLKRFQGIQAMKLENVIDGSLLFFQKYCVAEIRERMKAGRSGVILANDPGLGKTRTVEAAVADREAGIFCPNAVVSAWEEEAAEVLIHPDMIVLRDIPHRIRKELLRTRESMRYVTNVQFLQNTRDAERFELLSNDSMIAVHDEAHSRVNEHSEQSKGAGMLRHQFQINVTATPAKNPEAVRRMLKTLHPDDKRFANSKAFQSAFTADDPQSLRTLSLLLQRDMIRFRKSDVMEIVDPKQHLMHQKHKLPAKEFIQPENMGQYTMSERQAEAIYEMFLNWHEWTKRYDKYMPDDDIAQQDRLRTDGALTKRHALRQSINNPAYLGLRENDAKAAEMKKIVEHCLKRGRKVVIFCAYNAQTMKFAEMFKKYNPALYTGIMSDEGDIKDEAGKHKRFAKEHGVSGIKRGWIFDEHGCPFEDEQGDTMSALDYERLTFQNADERKVLIATYQAGAVGTTFTAGKAMVFDDLPSNVIEAIQSEDRIQRIDPDRLTHPTVEYYTLMSRYPKEFLEKMKQRWVVKDRQYRCYREFIERKPAEKFAASVDQSVATAFDTFFAQGTYDEVHHQNLKTQRIMFHLINDGIADEDILTEDQIRFPGLENGNDDGEA